MDGDYIVPRTLLYQKLWTEMAVKAFPTIEFVNCTEGGCLGVDPDTGVRLPFLMSKTLKQFALEQSALGEEG